MRDLPVTGFSAWKMMNNCLYLNKNSISHLILLFLVCFSWLKLYQKLKKCGGLHLYNCWVTLQWLLKKSSLFICKFCQTGSRVECQCWIFNGEQHFPPHFITVHSSAIFVWATIRCWGDFEKEASAASGADATREDVLVDRKGCRGPGSHQGRCGLPQSLCNTMFELVVITGDYQSIRTEMRLWHLRKHCLQNNLKEGERCAVWPLNSCQVSNAVWQSSGPSYEFAVFMMWCDGITLLVFHQTSDMHTHPASHFTAQTEAEKLNWVK